MLRSQNVYYIFQMCMAIKQLKTHFCGTLIMGVGQLGPGTFTPGHFEPGQLGEGHLGPDPNVLLFKCFWVSAR